MARKQDAIICYVGLGWRTVNLVLERWDADEKAWRRHSSAPTWTLLLDRVAAATYGDPTSAEGFATLRKLADEEQDRLTPKAGRNGLGWLARVPKYSTDADVEKHVAGDYRCIPGAPKPLPHKELPPVPATDRERTILDPDRLRDETLTAVERVREETIAAFAARIIPEVEAKERLLREIDEIETQAKADAMRPVQLDVAIGEAEQEYRSAVERGSGADQITALRTKRALELVRSKLVWHPAEEASADA